MIPLLTRLWLRVQEPRALSVIYFFAYLAVLVMGLAVALDPPRAVQGTLGQTLLTCWAGMLVIGGGIGAGTALQGAWFLERAGSILCMFAMAIYGVAVAGMPVSQQSLRTATLCFVVFSILAFAARLVNTRRYAYDPER
jgi:thiol:disulfide interchange protein